jgi:hypothetical protein
MTSKGLLFAVATVGTLAATTAYAQDLRERETQACMNDAFRLCSDYIPNENQVASCMSAKRSELTPGCRAFFTEANAKDTSGSSSRSGNDNSQYDNYGRSSWSDHSDWSSRSSQW